jgi:hypothetical protein
VTHREKMARNFVEKYGADRFRWLLSALAGNVPGSVIAKELSVSRERARQWKDAFGTVMVLYQVHADVQRIAEEER